ncbi:hypothetical protein OV760_26950, partial [Salmonella enterica subsp. enterica serovar 1,4,[5],12:i:-]|nr:hypothetical protein [Salmonella enterica subsp. enterica serovar 1,4,[5],12:i:-]
VVLPNGYKAGGKYNDKLSLQNTYEGEANLELWDQPRGSEQQKLEVKIVGKRVDPRSQTFDGQGSLSYTSRDKKNINAYVNAKKVPASSGKASNIAVELGSSGSLIDLPVSFKLESEVSNEYFDLDESLSLEDDLPPLSFKVSGSAGSDIQIDGVGKIGKPSTLEISGKLPETAGIKNFKLSTSALVDLGGDSSKENDKVKLSNSLKWNDNKLI